jgi:hypothetical protein
MLTRVVPDPAHTPSWPNPNRTSRAISAPPPRSGAKGAAEIHPDA